MNPPRSNKSRLAIIATAVATVAAPLEGMRKVAYYDPPGILTVCNGHTGPDVVKNKVYSIDECKALLAKDALAKVEAVDRCQPGLPDNVLIAFSDAAFNIGETVACDTAHSTAARYLRAHEYKKACDELPRWDKARVAGVLTSLPGLTKRRQIEREICLKGLS